MDDSVRLWLFQWTFTSTAANWYIELPQHLFVDSGSLETMFLTHFQLPICYEMGTDLLTSLWQNTSTHIFDHIHEWRRGRRIIKAPIPDQLLVDWVTKSLLPPISQDVAMGSTITEEQAISQAQYLDLVYSQSGILYDLIPQAPCPSIDPAKPPTEVPIDGIVGSIQSPLTAKPAKKPQTATPTPSNPKVFTEVNSI